MWQTNFISSLGSNLIIYQKGVKKWEMMQYVQLIKILIGFFCYATSVRAVTEKSFTPKANFEVIIVGRSNKD